MPGGRPRGGHRTLTGRRERERVRIRTYSARQKRAQSSEELPSTSSQSCSTAILLDPGTTQGHSTDNESYEPPYKRIKGEPLPEFKHEELLLDHDELNYNEGPTESMECEAATESGSGNSNYLINNESSTTEIKPEVVESQFETVFCEETIDKIKLEVEDEDNIFEEPDDISSSNTIRPVEPMTDLSSLPSTSNVDPIADLSSLPSTSNVDPIADLSSQPSTSNVDPCRTKFVRKKTQKSGTRCKFFNPSFIRCKFCANEFFSSAEDLTEHLGQKHSDISLDSDGAINSPIITYPGKVGQSQPPAVSLGKNPPKKPPGKSSRTVTKRDLLEGVFVSFKHIPLERREAAKVKIMELVGLIVKENINPSLVKISLL